MCIRDRRYAVLPHVFRGAAGLFARRIAVDLYSVESLSPLPEFRIARTDDMDFVAPGGQCLGFLPHSAVERDGEVLHEDEHCGPNIGHQANPKSVSYTHLTLPTNREV